MTIVQLVGNHINIGTIGKELKNLDNEVHYSEFDTLHEDFEEVIPDIVLMDFSDIQTALNKTRELIEIDHTACIFAMNPKKNMQYEDDLYSAGVRVVIDKPEEIQAEIDTFMDKLYGACNDLDHENCVGCWKTGRFENLQKLT